MNGYEILCICECMVLIKDNETKGKILSYGIDEDIYEASFKLYEYLIKKDRIVNE